jgi:uncharacterized membrane protein
MTGSHDPMARLLRKGIRRTQMAYLIAYIASALVMGVLDFVWLRLTVQAVYRPVLGSALADNPNMMAAVTFYLVYLVGVMIFAVRPALAGGDWRTAALYGALFGFFAYATYDLTNLATLKSWTLQVTLIDMAWGTFLTGTAASAGALAALKIFRAG